MLGSNDKMLPFRGYFFINHTVSPVFEFFYLFNVTAGGFGGSMIAGATGFNLVVIMHGLGKFAVLRRRLEELNGEDPDSVAVMSNYVIRHQEAIECASSIREFAIFTICFVGRAQKKIHFSRRSITNMRTRCFTSRRNNLFAGTQMHWRG